MNLEIGTNPLIVPSLVLMNGNNPVGLISLISFENICYLSSYTHSALYPERLKSAFNKLFVLS